MSEPGSPLGRVLARLGGSHPKRIDTVNSRTLSLDRIERLLTDLGRPQDRLPPVIHVAGTNGKGSTVAFLRAMAEAAGLRVHVLSSPHLVRFAERIRVAGTLIDDERLSELIDEVEAANAGSVTVANGKVPKSNPVTLPVGVYEWQASYSGDANNQPSSSCFGSETEIVIPLPPVCKQWQWGFGPACKNPRKKF